MVASRPEQQPELLASTDRYLAAILDELRAIRSQLVQEPQEPAPGPQLVTEPAPDRRPAA